MCLCDGSRFISQFLILSCLYIFDISRLFNLLMDLLFPIDNEIVVQDLDHVFIQALRKERGAPANIVDKKKAPKNPFCATSVTKILFFTRPVLKTPPPPSELCPFLRPPPPPPARARALDPSFLGCGLHKNLFFMCRSTPPHVYFQSAPPPSPGSAPNRWGWVCYKCLDWPLWIAGISFQRYMTRSIDSNYVKVLNDIELTINYLSFDTPQPTRHDIYIYIINIIEIEFAVKLNYRQSPDPHEYE